MFRDREEAGIQLADALESFRGQEVVVFALPRGGVVLEAQIAMKLDAPLDLVLNKKIGHPYNLEYAIGAIAEEGEMICDQFEVDSVDPVWFWKEVERTKAELKRRRLEYLGNNKPRDLKGKIVIIVDDGIATGLTMMAAVKAMEKRKAKQVIVAIPVTPYNISRKLIAMGVDLVSLQIDRAYLGAVGAYYSDFRQVTDGEVVALLKHVNG